MAYQFVYCHNMLAVEAYEINVKISEIEVHRIKIIKWFEMMKITTSFPVLNFASFVQY